MFILSESSFIKELFFLLFKLIFAADIGALGPALKKAICSGNGCIRLRCNIFLSFRAKEMHQDCFFRILNLQTSRNYRSISGCTIWMQQGLHERLFNR